MEKRRCLNCGKIIERKQNKFYCSRSCRNSHLIRRDVEEEPKYPKVSNYLKGEEQWLLEIRT